MSGFGAHSFHKAALCLRGENNDRDHESTARILRDSGVPSDEWRSGFNLGADLAESLEASSL